MTTENLERAKAKAAFREPISSILQGSLFALTIGGVMNVANAFAQGQVILALIFSFWAPLALLINARYVVPVWEGKGFKESLALYGGMWLVTNVLAALFALGFWHFHYSPFSSLRKN